MPIEKVGKNKVLVSGNNIHEAIASWLKAIGVVRDNDFVTQVYPTSGGRYEVTIQKERE